MSKRAVATVVQWKIKYVSLHLLGTLLGNLLSESIKCQIEQTFQRKVPLFSGGEIVIEETEEANDSEVEEAKES